MSCPGSLFEEHDFHLGVDQPPVCRAIVKQMKVLYDDQTEYRLSRSTTNSLYQRDHEGGKRGEVETQSIVDVGVSTVHYNRWTETCRKAREEKGSLGRTVGRRDVRVHCRVSKLRSEATTARVRTPT